MEDTESRHRVPSKIENPGSTDVGTPAPEPPWARDVGACREAADRSPSWVSFGAVGRKFFTMKNMKNMKGMKQCRLSYIPHLRDGLFS